MLKLYHNVHLFRACDSLSLNVFPKEVKRLIHKDVHLDIMYNSQPMETS